MKEENKNIEEDNDKEMLNRIRKLQEKGLSGILYKTLRSKCMHCDSCKSMIDIINGGGYDNADDILNAMKSKSNKALEKHMEKCWNCVAFREDGLYKAFIVLSCLSTLSTGKKAVVVRKYGKKVHELKEKGYKRIEIAEKLNISPNSVDKCLREWNEELEESFNKKKNTEPRVVTIKGKEKRFNFWVDFGEEYKRLKAEGKKDGEIARMYGVSSGTLSSHKRKYKWDK